MKRIIGYLGSKINLFQFLKENMILKFDTNIKYTFVDLFSGTGSVSKLINKDTNWDVIANDLSLYSKILNVQILLYKLSKNEIESLLDYLTYLDELELIEGDFFNEFSMGGTPKTIDDLNIFSIKKKNDDGTVFYDNNQDFQFSRMFFKAEVGKKIDTVKNEIKKLYETNEISETKKDLLLLFLLNYTNKNSNHTGVYGAYLKYDKHKNIKPFVDLDLVNYITNNYKTMITKNNYVSNNLADVCIENLQSFNLEKETTIVYMDPPYSTRSYEANYHILDYLCDFNFNINQIKKNSKSATKDSRIKNPFNSKNETINYFEKLISESIKISNNIFISYSNEGLISENDMLELTDKHNLHLNTYYKEYKRYTSGENNGENTGKKNVVTELIWHISNI